MAQVQDVPAEIKEQTIFVKDIPISMLRVRYVTEADGYARAENPRRTAKLTKGFDPLAVGVLYLSLQDDGTYNVIDGQHRFKAALESGYETVDGYVYIDLTNEEEAALYRKFGDYLGQTPRDKFLAALVEGQPEAVAINRMLFEHGLHVSAVGGPQRDGINAVKALELVTREAGPQILRDTLTLLREVFAGDMRGFSGTAIQGTAGFLERFQKNDSFNRKKLVDEMRREGLMGISVKMNAVRAVETSRKDMQSAAAWGRALLLLHDTGLRTRRLGVWPDRVIREADKERLRTLIREKATPAGIVQRRMKAAEAAIASARCPACRAMPGAACKRTEHGHVMSMNGQVHKERYTEYRNVQRRVPNGSH